VNGRRFNMALSIETYALCKKYCDEHAASLTPE